MKNHHFMVSLGLSKSDLLDTALIEVTQSKAGSGSVEQIFGRLKNEREPFELTVNGNFSDTSRVYSGTAVELYEELPAKASLLTLFHVIGGGLILRHCRKVTLNLKAVNNAYRIAYILRVFANQGITHLSLNFTFARGTGLDNINEWLEMVTPVIDGKKKVLTLAPAQDDNENHYKLQVDGVEISTEFKTKEKTAELVRLQRAAVECIKEKNAEQKEAEQKEADARQSQRKTIYASVFFTLAVGALIPLLNKFVFDQDDAFLHPDQEMMLIASLAVFAVSVAIVFRGAHVMELVKIRYPNNRISWSVLSDMQRCIKDKKQYGAPYPESTENSAVFSTWLAGLFIGLSSLSLIGGTIWALSVADYSTAEKATKGVFIGLYSLLGVSSVAAARCVYNSKSSVQALH